MGVLRDLSTCSTWALSSAERTYDALGMWYLSRLGPSGWRCRCSLMPGPCKSAWTTYESFSPNVVFIILYAMFFSQCMTSRTWRTRRSFCINHITILVSLIVHQKLLEESTEFVSSQYNHIAVTLHCEGFISN